MAFAIYGTGGFGREVAPLVYDYWLHNFARTSTDEGHSIVFVDDATDAPPTCNGRPVINFAALSSDEHKHRTVTVAIGSGEIRRKIESKCIAAGLQVGSLVAQTSRILDEVEIGSGAILCDFTTITSNVRIGKSFQCNIYSYVAHDCIIGDYVTFAPRVNCNGNVHIGNNVYVGTGAMFIQGTKSEPLIIGEGAVIGMGAVVTKPVLPKTVVAGNPARAIRTLD